MKSGHHNIEIENGSQFDMVLTITNDDGTDYSLSGYTADMQIRTTNSTLILDCSSYISIINGNEINVTIPASATTSEVDSGVEYQIEITSGSAEYSILRGNVRFIKAVIR